MHTDDREEKDWMNALAGREHERMDSLARTQAQAVRKALLARRAAIEADAFQPDVEQFDRLRMRLEREGLLKPKTTDLTATLWQRLLALLRFSGKVANTRPENWINPDRVKVTLFRSVRGDSKIHQPKEDFDSYEIPEFLLNLESPQKITHQTPQAKLEELRAGLQEVTSEFTVRILSDGRIMVDIQASDAAMEYLYTQGLKPTVQNGSVRILIIKLIQK